MLALARRLGADGARHRPLRAPRRRRRGAAAGGGRRRRQGPDLHALGAAAARPWRGCASRSPGCASPRSASSRPSAGPDRGLEGREPGPLLPRGRGQARASWLATAASASGRARSSTADGAVLGEHRGHHEFTVGQRRGIGIGGPRAALRPGHRRRLEPGRRRARARSSPPRRVRVRDATLHRPGGRVDRVRAALPLAADRVLGGPVAAGEHDELEIELWTSPPTASRRARPRA